MHLTRLDIRHLAALAAAVMSGIYFLIGFSVLDIGGTTTGEATDQLGFGSSAGIAFLVLALLLLFTDHRWLWAIATVVLALIFLTYIGASAIRVPPFEVWGLTLRLIQIPLMVAVGYLAIKPLDAAVSPVARKEAQP
jgi:hypothetical protein